MTDLLISWGPMLIFIAVWLLVMRRAGWYKHQERSEKHMERVEAQLERIASLLERHRDSGGFGR
jgi:hypothetical protein